MKLSIAKIRPERKDVPMKRRLRMKLSVAKIRSERKDVPMKPRQLQRLRLLWIAFGICTLKQRVEKEDMRLVNLPRRNRKRRGRPCPIAVRVGDLARIMKDHAGGTEGDGTVHH